jgi:Arc/MetJ-type ribon-helix-helix transcriptional regulator
MAENEQTIPVQIRFPPEIVRRIDMKIDSGEFTSRADYVRYVTTRSFEDEDEVDRLKVALYDLLSSGVADDVLREQIRKINREVW